MKREHVSGLNPEEIKAVRIKAGYTMEEAATLIFHGRSSWCMYEKGKRKMHPALGLLFAIRSGLVPPDVSNKYLLSNRSQKEDE